MQEAMANYVRYLTLLSAIGLYDELYIPKTHLMFHMLHRSKLLGNPLEYATFFDEGLNRLLKLALRNCHQSRFEDLSLAKMEHVLASRGTRPKRKMEDLDDNDSHRLARISR